jgi:hypothetical protein
MLHSLPALLDELEHKLKAGENPLPLLASIRWPDVIDWPRGRAEAGQLQQRLQNLGVLLQGLHAPLQATLMRLDPGATYAAKGGYRATAMVSQRFGGCV